MQLDDRSQLYRLVVNVGRRVFRVTSRRLFTYHGPNGFASFKSVNGHFQAAGLCKPTATRTGAFEPTS